MSDVGRDTSRGSYYDDPFSQHVITRNSHTETTSTLFQHFVDHGANLLAIDHYGKHALFHLLEAYEPGFNYRLPRIQASVRYVTNNVRKLLNQPDKAGNYPLHAELQRVRRYLTWNRLYHTAELEASVHDLLIAGADPKACDERGNTALHYVTDDNLVDPRRASGQRQLFQVFLDHGVDINARNGAGRSAVELLLEDYGEDWGVGRRMIVVLRMYWNGLRASVPVWLTMARMVKPCSTL